jgi:hypothetical protein
MVDVVSRMCLCTKAQPHFGLPGDKPTHCAACKTRGMVDVVSRMCLFTKARPSFGLSGDKPTHCTSCKTRGMVNVLSRKCRNGCDTTVGDRYKGYCLRCFVYLFPGEKVSRNFKVKEQHFIDYITEAGVLPDHAQVTFDKPLQGGCSARKPDIFVDVYTHTVHCENDEDQHRNYACENKRSMELFQDAGNRPQVQLRFNPDGFTSEDGVKHPGCFKYNIFGVPVIRDRVVWAARMDAFLERLTYHLTHVPDRDITIEHMFYNGSKQVGEKRKRLMVSLASCCLLEKQYVGSFYNRYDNPEWVVGHLHCLHELIIIGGVSSDAHSFNLIRPSTTALPCLKNLFGS